MGIVALWVPNAAPQLFKVYLRDYASHAKSYHG
jgi:hypothetical protein